MGRDVAELSHVGQSELFSRPGGGHPQNSRHGAVEGEHVSLRLDEPQFGISAGQAAVLYTPDNPDRVLGGGWFVEAPSAALHRNLSSEAIG